MNREKIRQLTYDILCVLGFTFLIIVVHEIVHYIDGYGPNIAVCFGFTNVHRMGFVINGDNYTLFNGELLAYAVDIVLAVVIFWLLYKRKNKNDGGKQNGNVNI